MRGIARERLTAAVAERARALSEYQRAVGTPAERARLARLQAANLAVAMRDRSLRIAGARDAS